MKNELNNQQHQQQQQYNQQKQQYLTIRQDPYPPISNSPEFLINNNSSGMSDTQMSSIIDCIEMNSDAASFDASRDLSFIKKEELFAVNDLFNTNN